MLSRSALLLCLLTIVAGGCKAGEAKDAGFVDKSHMKKDPNLPFQRAWMKPGFEKSKYTRLYVAPVNTAYMLQMTDWEKGERKADVEKDVVKLGVYTQDAIKKAFRDDPAHRLKVVDAPTTAPGTLTIEFALIEVVPSKVALNALGYAPFGIGLGISALRAMAKDVSTAAMEMRIRDATTRETVCMFADREAEQVAVVSVRGLTWYSHAQAIISQWSDQLVKVVNRKPGDVIKDSDPFTLKPW